MRLGLRLKSLWYPGGEWVCLNSPFKTSFPSPRALFQSFNVVSGSRIQSCVYIARMWRWNRARRAQTSGFTANYSESTQAWRRWGGVCVRTLWSHHIDHCDRDPVDRVLNFEHLKKKFFLIIFYLFFLNVALFFQTVVNTRRVESFVLSLKIKTLLAKDGYFSTEFHHREELSHFKWNESSSRFTRCQIDVVNHSYEVRDVCSVFFPAGFW